MRVSVVIDTGRPWRDIEWLARRLDELPVHAVYVPDHLMAHRDDGFPSAKPMLEAWSAITALAARTSRVRLGSLVLSSTFRHPALVANMASALDHISDGRVILGLGAGWQPNEHAAYGIELHAPRQRLDRFEETCHLLASLLRQERTTYSGRYFQMEDAICRPAPVQTSLPLLVGGDGERRTLRIAAQYADLWHTWAEPVEFSRKSAILDDHCRAVGRQASTILRSTGAFVDDPGRTTEVVAGYRKVGADEFVLRDHRAQSPARTLATVWKALE